MKNVSVFNVISFFMMQYVINVGAWMIFSYDSFILRDKNYYKIPEDDVASVMVKVGLIDELICICFDFFLGPIYDILGRKWPSIFGVLLSGIG